MTKTNFLNLLSSLRSEGAKTFNLTVNGNAINLMVDGEPHTDRLYRGENVARECDRLKRWLGVWMYDNPIPVIKNTAQEDDAIKAAGGSTVDVLTVGFRYYRFDTSYDDELRAYQDLCADVRQRNGGSYIARQTLGSWNPSKDSQAFHSALQVYGLNNTTVDIDTSVLFADQFNTPKGVITKNGVRLYLWAEYTYPNAAIKEGYFLIDDKNILKNRLATTHKCGWCNAQYNADKARELDYCCDACIGGSLLDSKHINLLKLLPLTAPHNAKREFSPEQFKIVQARVIDAQLQAKSARDARYFPEMIESVNATFSHDLRHLQRDHDGKLWLLENQIKIEDVIYYKHTGRFAFGWRGEGMDQAKADKLKTLLNGFPFEYDIVVKGGK